VNLLPKIRTQNCFSNRVRRFNSKTPEALENNLQQKRYVKGLNLATIAGTVLAKPINLQDRVMVRVGLLESDLEEAGKSHFASFTVLVDNQLITGELPIGSLIFAQGKLITNTTKYKDGSSKSHTNVCISEKDGTFSVLSTVPQKIEELERKAFSDE